MRTALYAGAVTGPSSMGEHSTAAILCVDDDPNMLRTMERLLADHEYTVLTALGGAEALRILQSSREGHRSFDIGMVITDQRMPGMTGVELLRQVQAMAPDCIRIILTGFMDQKDAIDAVNTGGLFRYLLKPWDEHDFLTTVQAGLGHYALIRRYRRLQEETFQQNQELMRLNGALHERVEELRLRNEQITQVSEQLKKDIFESLGMLLRILEIHRPRLVGHLRRVASHVQRLGAMLRMTDPELQLYVTAGLLHDVGFAGVPAGMHSKPMVFWTEEEKPLIANHCRLSMEAVSGLRQLKPIAAIIMSHHERFDGQGFPQGLKGESIPFGARLIAVADEYDYLVAPSGEPVPDLQDTAIRYLRNERGLAFDPLVVDRFIQYLTEVKEAAHAISITELTEGMILAKNLTSGDSMPER